jgi:hypothetical protein
LIAEAIYKVNVALLDTAIDDFPEISEEIEADLDQHGRYL